MQHPSLSWSKNVQRRRAECDESRKIKCTSRYKRVQKRSKVCSGVFFLFPSPLCVTVFLMDAWMYFPRCTQGPPPIFPFFTNWKHGFELTLYYRHNTDMSQGYALHTSKSVPKLLKSVYDRKDIKFNLVEVERWDQGFGVFRTIRPGQKVFSPTCSIACYIRVQDFGSQWPIVDSSSYSNRPASSRWLPHTAFLFLHVQMAALIVAVSVTTKSPIPCVKGSVSRDHDS